MNQKAGVIINRLVLGFVFAFIYQIVVAIATSIFSIPLTGTVQDLFLGIEKIDSDGFLFIIWWIISTLIITTIALLIVKNRKYLSPYKEEKNIDIPPKITILSAVVIGTILSFWFFLLDTVIGFFTIQGSQTDFNAIYEAASAGDFGPLIVSIIFSIAAGFIIVGIASKTAVVKEITDDMGFKKFTELGKLLTKKSKSTTTFADTAGLSPGALVHVGEKKVKKIKFSIINYDKNELNEKTDCSLEECLDVKGKKGVSWINISGIHDPSVIESFGNYFELHPLVQSDIMNTELRPKFVNHDDDYLQIILKVPHFNNSQHELELEQISLIVGKNFLLSFQETEGDIFDPIRKRIREGMGKIRTWNSDYLAYAITDTIVDHFYVIMEDMDAQTDTLEEELMKNPTTKTLQHIQRLKREMALLRKTIWPTREVIDGLDRSPSLMIANDTKTYLKDVYSHTIQVMDTIESLREVVGGMMDTYLSSLSNRMNEVMKTLTIIASIFIPITFIAGIYGTNFEYIPELTWHGSYFVMLGVMSVIVIIMIAFFRKKHWI